MTITELPHLVLWYNIHLMPSGDREFHECSCLSLEILRQRQPFPKKKKKCLLNNQNNSRANLKTHNSHILVCFFFFFKNNVFQVTCPQNSRQILTCLKHDLILHSIQTIMLLFMQIEQIEQYFKAVVIKSVGAVRKFVQSACPSVCTFTLSIRAQNMYIHVYIFVLN